MPTSSRSGLWSMAKVTPIDLFAFFFVFIAILVTAKFGQYIFFAAQISPAVIWPPAGISLAAVLLGGYRMTIPIALATFIAAISSPAQAPLLIVVINTIAQTITPVLGAYGLRRLGFSGSFERMKDVLLFMLGTVFIAAITPSIMVPAQFLMNTLGDSAYVSWTRSWAGRVLSILVLTPLILAWLPWKPITIQEGWKALEAVLALGLVGLSVYLLFWTSLAQSYSFLLLLGLFAGLFWVSGRFDSRAVMTALFATTTLGMAGAIIYAFSDNPLNQRLFSIELFVILIAPIFYIVSALIKERREAAEVLNDHIRKLEEAMRRLNLEDQSKNEFISILAHELRNPLAPVMSTLELLKLQKDLSDDSIHMIESAEQQTYAMRRLLDDLLDVARVTQKKFKLVREPTDIRTVIQHSLRSTENIMNVRGHTVHMTLPTDSVWLDADPVRLEQIMVNLLNNAAKYTEPGGTIQLSCTTKAETALITVRDNGIGIPPEVINDIFLPFRQVPAATQAGTGLGIGLSLTKRLVEMHGGTIKAESDGVGKGSTFTVQLPIPPQMQLALPRVAPKKKKAAKTAPLKILVVDDNEAAADGLGKLLTYKGHEVVCAYNGAKAIEAMSSFDPRVVLLDIGLPDQTGYDVAMHLRSMVNKPLTLVALTGYGQEEDKAKAKQAGFDHHLIKPVGIAEVEALLSKIKNA